MAKAKPGKYDEAVRTLKRQGVVDASYQDRVNKVKDELKPLDVVDVAEEYIELRKGNGTTVSGVFLALIEDLARVGLKPDLTAEQERHMLVAILGKEGIESLKALCDLRLEAATQLLVESQDRGDGPWGSYGVKPNALRLESGDTIRVQVEPYGQVKDKAAFRQWCVDNGYEMQLQLWPTTMNAIVKERRVNGDPDPAGVEVFRKETVKLIAAGGGDE